MANVTIEMTGDEKAYIRSLDRAIERTAKLEQRLAQTGGTAARAGQQASSAFGGRFASGLGSAIGAMGKLTMAVGGISMLMSEIGREAERVSQRQRAYRLDVTKLAQLAGSRQESLELVKAAATIARDTGMPMEQASDLVFQLKSAGAMEEMPFFAELRAAGLTKDPAVVAEAAQRLRIAMGAEETGSFRDLVSKMIVAGGPSIGSIEQLAAAASGAGAWAKGLGWSDEEVLAATGILAKVSPSEEAGTQLESFLVALGQKGEFGGLGLMGTLEKLRSMQIPEGKLREYFGRKEGAFAAQVLAGSRAELEQLLGDVNTAAARDVVGQQMGFTSTAPDVVAGLYADQATQAAEIAKTRLGVAGSVAEGVIQRRSAAFAERGGWLNEQTAIWGERLERLGMMVFGHQFVTGSGHLTDKERRLVQMGDETRPPVDPLGGAIEGRGGALQENTAALKELSAKMGGSERTLKVEVGGSKTLGGPDHDPKGH